MHTQERSLVRVIAHQAQRFKDGGQPLAACARVQGARIRPSRNAACRVAAATVHPRPSPYSAGPRPPTAQSSRSLARCARHFSLLAPLLLIPSSSSSAFSSTRDSPSPHLALSHTFSLALSSQHPICCFCIFYLLLFFGPAYPPPNLRLCASAPVPSLPSQTPKREQSAPVDAPSTPACLPRIPSRPCSCIHLFINQKNFIFAASSELCAPGPACQPATRDPSHSASSRSRSTLETLLIAPTTLPIGRFSIHSHSHTHTLPYSLDLNDP